MLILPDVLDMVWGREKGAGQDKVQMNPSWLLGGVEGVGRSGREFYLLCLGWSNFCIAGSDRMSVKYLKERLRGKWNVGDSATSTGWGQARVSRQLVAVALTLLACYCTQPGIRTILLLMCWQGCTWHNVEFDHSGCNSIFSKAAKLCCWEHFLS